MGKEQKSKAWLHRDNPVSSQVLITYKVVFFKLHLFTAVVENRSFLDYFIGAFFKIIKTR